MKVKTAVKMLTYFKFPLALHLPWTSMLFHNHVTEIYILHFSKAAFLDTVVSGTIFLHLHEQGDHYARFITNYFYDNSSLADNIEQRFSQFLKQKKQKNTNTKQRHT